MPTTTHVLAEPRRAYELGIALNAAELSGTDQATRDRNLDRIASLGCTWLRTDAYWAALEPTKGTHQWAGLDATVDGARARGIRVVLCAHTTPTWARPNGATDPDVWGPTTQAAIDGYATFVAALADRYAGRVEAVEVWNEPNLDRFWSPTPDPAAWVALLHAAHDAIKTANPDMGVIGGGTGGAGSPADIDAIAWLTDTIAAGSTQWMDGQALHPYTNNDGAASGEMSRTALVRRMFDDAGARHVILWATETGAPTAGSDGGTVTEDQQALLVSRLCRHWRAVPRTGPVFLYTLNDIPGDTREAFFGLYGRDGREKCSCSGVRVQNRARTSRIIPATITTA